MVRRRYPKAEVLQSSHGVLTESSRASRGKLEVAPRIGWFEAPTRGTVTVWYIFKEVKLDFRSYSIIEALLYGSRDTPFQHETRVSKEGLPIRSGEITHEPRGRRSLPWDNGKG